MTPETIAAIGAVVGLGGLVFAALNWRREDTGKVVAQQAQVFENMRALNDELRLELDRVRAERDKVMVELEKVEDALEKDVADRAALEAKRRELEASLQAAMVQIEELQQKMIDRLEEANGHG